MKNEIDTVVFADCRLDDEVLAAANQAARFISQYMDGDVREVAMGSKNGPGCDPDMDRSIQIVVDPQANPEVRDAVARNARVTLGGEIIGELPEYAQKQLRGLQEVVGAQSEWLSDVLPGVDVTIRARGPQDDRYFER